MAVKKFKLERDRLEEVQISLSGMMLRAKLLMADITHNDLTEEYLFHLTQTYYQTSFHFSQDIEKLLTLKGKQFIVTDSVIERFSSNKKTLDDIEQLISNSGKYSLKVH